MVTPELRAMYHTRMWWRFPWSMKLVYIPFLLTQWGIAACVYPLFIGLLQLFEMRCARETPPRMRNRGEDQQLRWPADASAGIPTQASRPSPL